MRCLSASALVVAALLSTPYAHAADEPGPAELQRARALFAEAERDEQAGQWAAALDKLERALAVKRTAGLRFHIALCLENLDRLPEALASYELAAIDAAAANVTDVLEAIREPLAALRARVPTLTVQLAPAERARGGPPPALELDGRRALALGEPLRVSVGAHRLRALRPSDGAAFTRELFARERDAIVVEVLFPERSGGGSPGAQPTSDRAGPTVASPTRTGAIAATSASVLLLGGGIASFLVAGGRQDELGSCTTRPACEDVQQSVRLWDGVALGAFVGSAAAAAVAVVLWTRSAGPGATPASAAGRW